MNRNERRTFGVQLRSTVKTLATTNLESLAEGNLPVAMSTAEEIGGYEQHMAVVVCVDPELSSVLAEFIQELLSGAEGEEGEEGEEE